MERTLSRLFDYQKFENNSRLSKLIQETEERYARVLSDEELYMVNAAGETLGDTNKILNPNRPDNSAD